MKNQNQQNKDQPQSISIQVPSAANIASRRPLIPVGLALDLICKMKKIVTFSCIIIYATISSCESEVQINKNLDIDLSAFNGLWDLEIFDEKLYLCRNINDTKIKFDLTFECRSNHKSFLVLNDSIFLFFNENPLCDAVYGCIKADRISNTKNSVYIKNGEIKGLDFGTKCEDGISIVRYRIKYREYRKSLISFKKNIESK
jgi:hypothetical protein